MNKITYLNTMEYLSLILVLTFIPLHNIYLVFTGILLAIYIIKKNYINGIIKELNKKIFNLEETKMDKSIERDSHNTDLIDENIKISLVEKVEESGIIPSLLKDDHDDIAA